MEERPRRSRPVIRSVTFSEVEWERAARRLTLSGMGSFTEFARSALLDGEVVVKRVAFNPKLLRAELSRIGNNVNQIARHVNVEDAVTYAEMRAVKRLLGQVQQLIANAQTSTDEQVD